MGVRAGRGAGAGAGESAGSGVVAGTVGAMAALPTALWVRELRVRVPELALQSCNVSTTFVFV